MRKANRSFAMSIKRCLPSPQTDFSSTSTTTTTITTTTNTTTTLNFLPNPKQQSSCLRLRSLAATRLLSTTPTLPKRPSSTPGRFSRTSSTAVMSPRLARRLMVTRTLLMLPVVSRLP